MDATRSAGALHGASVIWVISTVADVAASLAAVLERVFGCVAQWAILQVEFDMACHLVPVWDVSMFRVRIEFNNCGVEILLLLLELTQMSNLVKSCPLDVWRIVSSITLFVVFDVCCVRLNQVWPVKPVLAMWSQPTFFLPTLKYNKVSKIIQKSSSFLWIFTSEVIQGLGFFG